MHRIAIAIALLAALPASAQTVDVFGRLVTVNGKTYSVPGISVTAPSLSAALNVLSGLAPEGWQPPAPPPQTVIPRAAFTDRFMPAEKAAIVGTPKLLALWLELLGYDQIDVTDPRVVGGVSQLVAGGAVAPERAASILAH